MRINSDFIPYTYEESKKVFEGSLLSSEAAENIFNNCGIKINSAKDYPQYFKYLMTGSGTCRNLNSFTQEYYLKQIREDYGVDQFRKSLSAYKPLIEKFEKQNSSIKHSMRKIYNKHINSL